MQAIIDQILLECIAQSDQIEGDKKSKLLDAGNKLLAAGDTVEQNGHPGQTDNPADKTPGRRWQAAGKMGVLPNSDLARTVLIELLIHNWRWRDACESAGVQQAQVIFWSRTSPLYNAVLQQVELQARQSLALELEQLAIDRATGVTTQPIYDRNGKYVGDRPDRSDRMHEILLRGNLPGRYGAGATGEGQQINVIIDV